MTWDLNVFAVQRLNDWCRAWTEDRAMWGLKKSRHKNLYLGLKVLNFDTLSGWSRQLLGVLTISN